MANFQTLPTMRHEHSIAIAALRVGQTYTVPGLTARDVRAYIARAKRGSGKWFESRTLTTGACIRRIE